jgi:ATP-binding cassette subfamily B protein
VSDAIHEDEVLGKAYDARLMRRLLVFVRPHVGILSVSAFLLCLAVALEFLGPHLVRLAIDGPLTEVSGPRAGDALRRFWNLCLIYAGVILTHSLVAYLHTVSTAVMGQRILYEVRTLLFGHLQRLGLPFFDRNPVGRLVTRVTSDVQALNELFTSGMDVVVSDLLKIIVTVVVLLLIDVRLALIALAVLPFLIVVSFLFRTKVREFYREIRARLAQLNAFLQETVSGIRVVQVFTRERKVQEKFDRIQQGYLRVNLKSVLAYALFFPALEILGAFSTASVLWFGGRFLAVGTLTPGEFVQFWFYVRLLFEPLRDLSEKYNILQAAMASSERIFKILDTPEDAQDPPDAHRPERMAGAVEFRDVWFSYRPGLPVLKGLSFRVAPGESVAVVGATGAGKTTLTQVIGRYYDVERGAVLVDGVDVRRWDKRWLRRQIGIVLQDVFLFSGTIERNIRLLQSDLPFERVVEAARTVHADRFIERLPGGYHAEVKERGATLSVGQKQLLAFARALAFDPRILILDEATASVDTETELLIQDAMRRLLKGRTSIVIAHRLSTIRSVDRILVLHHGELREEGTHEELLRRRGIYHRLYRLQYRGQEEEPAPAAAPPA